MMNNKGINIADNNINNNKSKKKCLWKNTK